MARIYPADITRLALAGAHSHELVTLQVLKDKLPNDYAVFHGVHWSREYQSWTVYGEIDFVIVNRRNWLFSDTVAVLYDVETRVLVQAVKRNIERFPKDFMFQLTETELSHLRSQSVTSSDWGGRRYPPHAFTEQGVAMLSSVLRSERAVQVNIEIMRTFVRLREMLAGHVERAQKRTALERKYDAQFKVVFDASVS